MHENTPVRLTSSVPSSGVRLRRRRLYQGCALLLIIPAVAAFLPLQERAADPVVSLVPVKPSVATAHPAGQSSLLQAVSRLPSQHKPSRMARLASFSGLSSLSGLASWYGNNFGGHHTASGDIFDPHALTACHRSLPFGTLVRVVNLLNNKSVLVRINDRGVLSGDRVIDLSSGAAEQIDMLRAGVAKVRLEVLSTPGGAPSATPAPAEDASKEPAARF